ncbi:MAG: membrane protein insertase YidC [Gammaproteobacteria bacterium]|nr:membrane protein insertase YidC [Gammaproteobacteria bacterium]
MDNQRLFLFFALALVLMLIWQAWEQENVRPPEPAAVAAKPDSQAAAPGVPQAPAVPAAVPAPKAAEALSRGGRIQIRTDLVDAVIDTQGGDLRQLALRHYPIAADKPEQPFPLMQDEGNDLFVAQSGLIGLDGQYPNHKTRFTAEAASYSLADDRNELRVPMTFRAPDGVQYIKTYVFHRGSYVVDVEFEVKNASRHEWSGYFYGQFQRTHTATGGFLNVTPSYVGGAIYTPENKYEKIPLDKMAEKPLKRQVTGGWVAMLQHYFVGSWMLAKDERNEFYSDVLDNTRHILGFKNVNPTKVAPGASGVIRASLYAGPKEHKILKALPEGMDLTVDYGWLTVISAPLFWLLSAIHRLLGNWGWAIIVLTILIKAVFYPLSATSYKSMAHMRKMQPKMAALKERYGDDRQKLNQAMMELYKTEKINPLGGCLPILIQIPVFLALYWVLLESVEMRQAPWIGWIKDLSAQDPYYILPIIMGVSMFAQQKLNPQPVDPVQQKVFMIMPVIFTGMFLFFPAGLVLYWTVNNILSIAQQWRITRLVEGKK